MDSARHARLKQAFNAACEAPASERAAVLDRECAGDDALRAEVESLLVHESEPVIDLEAASRTLLDEALRPPPRREATGRIGGYQLVEVIGEGGMGVVYRARQESPRREVALKVLRARFVTDTMLRRFEREAEALGRLHHPGIAQIFEAGVEDGAPHGATPYFVMEYVQGPTLLEYAQRRNLPTRARIEQLILVCDAVEHAHRRGVVHRDLKPANILVDESAGRPQPRILDFGIARITGADGDAQSLVTQTGELLGTLSYMSPEQIVGDGARIDERTDVYSLGVVLFELLTGRLAHNLRNKPVAEAVRIVSERDPMRLGAVEPAFRGDLDTIVATALERDPARRYASPGDLGRDLRRFLDDQPIAARPASTIYTFRKFARRNRSAVVGAGAVFVALLAGTVATAVQARRAISARDRAEAEAEASREVSAFLHDVFTSVDPVMAIGRQVTVHEALDQAVERQGQLLASGPLVHASLARTMGLAYRSIGEHVTGEPHLRRAMELRTANLGPDNPDTLESANDLALALIELRRLEEAESIARDARARAALAPGAESDLYARLTSALAIARYWRGDLEGAERIGRESLALNEALHGPTGRRTLAAMSNLGLTLTDFGKLDEADDLLTRCEAQRMQTLGPDHPETLFARVNVAKLRIAQGRLDEARAMTAENVERGAVVFGPGHPDLLGWVRNLALFDLGAGRNAEAAAILQDSRQYLLIDGARTHPSAIHHLGLLATALLAWGEVEEAREVIDQVYALSVAVFGEDDVETARARTLYVDLYEQLGDAENQALWTERLRGTPFDPNAPP